MAGNGADAEELCVELERLGMVVKVSHCDAC
jgi:hypothetical protein